MRQRPGARTSPDPWNFTYFSLGEDAEQNASAYLGDYYGWLGDEVSAMIAASAAKKC